MTPEENDPYQRAGLVLILGAMLFLILAFLGAGQAIASLLIVSSLGLFLTGILLLTFTRGRTPDPAVFSFLDVQHQANTATLLFRAGSRDPPVFTPSRELDGGVAQFHALPAGSPLCREAGAPASSHGGRTGLILPPACLPLMRELETRFHLRVPADPGRLPQLFDEVALEILEIADRVVTAVEPGEIRVDLLGFALYPGCRAARAGFPDTCLLSPCTICSLFACLAVRATRRECQLVAMDLDDRQESVRLVISFSPRIRETPAVAPERIPGSMVPGLPVPPAPGGPVPPAPGEPVSLSVSELIRKAGEGLVPPRQEGPVSPSPGEPVMPPVPSSPPVEPVVTIPEEPAEEPEAPPSQEKDHVPAWWSGHPGTRRLRYFR